MTNVSTYDTETDVAIVSINSPPVNALGFKVRQGIADGIGSALGNAQICAIVLICGGRTFFAGADISEFGGPARAPDLHDILDIIENSSKPIIAAMHGTALGGGLETALACHYRVAAPSAKFGLPEVALGIMPGAGGTQRLPRLVDVETALDLIISGKQIGAKVAKDIGLIDRIAEEGALRDNAVAYARSLAAEQAPLRKVRDLEDKIAAAREDSELFARARKKHARAFKGFKAPGHIILAVEAAVNLPFEAGIKYEKELVKELLDSSQSKAQRYLFFAERATTKIPDLPDGTASLQVSNVGVIGAGTMGGGIAMNFLNIGVPVTIVEVAQEALDRGISVIRKNYENSAKKGSLTPEEVAGRMELLTGTTDFAALADKDLIIEAAFEAMEVKKQVFAQLDRFAKPDAILASNTSFLDLNEIAAATGRPAQVIGLHFFSPANVMKLLEVVRGEQTALALIATAMKLAKRIGKIPVLSRVCHGFIANRAMAKRSAQANRLILEGATPDAVDRVLTDYGFAMGQFAMIDLVGLDVIKAGPGERTIRGELVARGRLGQKKNGGFYDYDEARNPTPSPVALEIIAEFAREQNIAQRSFTDADLLARLLYPVVNEGAKILEEGIAIRASDIDVAITAGYNWPIYTGGPMFWSEQIGLDKIVAGLKEFEATHGEEFKPAKLLEEMALSGKQWKSV